MPTGEAKSIVRRFIDEVFVRGQSEAVDELVTDDFISHGLPGSGPAVLKSAIERVSAGLSDVKMELQDLFAEDDRVAVRLRSMATHSGEFMGLPATGKTYDVEEIHIFRLDDGKIAEHWHQLDSMSMMQQLGAISAPSGE